jgi:N-hydroxyarylamine O-acetyltransferase
VPFENLDIHSNKWIELENSFKKVVLHHRGGFCYELNGLFFQLLQAFGFDCFLISGCVANDQGVFGPEFDHMAIIVRVEGELYLVDVGFGEFSLEPLKISKGESIFDPRGTFRFDNYDDGRILIQKVIGRKVIPKYHFSLKERLPGDFKEMCKFHQTDPSSPFTKRLLCSFPVPNGRITLTGSVLRITRENSVEQRKINSKEELSEILLNYFGMGEW